MDVRFLSETPTTVTFGWDVPVGQQIVRLTRPDGVQTRVWSQTKNQHTFKTKLPGSYLVDALGMIDSGAGVYPPPVVEPPPPPPPPSGLSPIGWLKNVWGGWWPPTNADKYGIAAAYGPPPAAFKGISLRYLTAVTCYPDAYNSSGVDLDVALASGWILEDSAGNLVKRGAPYTTGYVADVGHPGYRQAFCEMAVARIAASQEQGAWIDDAGPRILSMTGGVRPAKYPTDAAYEDVVAGFISFVHDYFKQRNLLDVWNTAIPQDNTGALARAWWARIGPNAGGLCIEYWMTPTSYTFRKVGPEWWNNWDGFRALHGVCQAAGCHFFGMNGDRGAQEYALATFLLDWDGSTGSCQWNKDIGSTGYVAKDDPWTAVCDRVIALGQPTGAAVKTGNVWKRPFENGYVEVDPVAGTARIVAA